MDYNQPLVGGPSVHPTPATQIANLSLPGGSMYETLRDPRICASALAWGEADGVDCQRLCVVTDGRIRLPLSLTQDHGDWDV